MSDYLWDKEGEPDPEVERLETLLQPMAYRGQPPRVPGRRSRMLWVSAAGVLAVSAIVALLLLRAPTPPTSGAWIATGSDGIRIRIGDLGTVDFEAGTRARVLESGPTHRLRLERGALVARINAPPRVFVIETPHARITNLGCAFRVTVDKTGHGTLTVTEGQVALSTDGAPEVIIPAGHASALTGVTLQAPTPTLTPTPKPEPVPAPVAEPQPASAAAPAPARHTRSTPKHSTPKPKSAPAPAPAPKTPAKSPPAPAPTKPGVNLNHDALKNLERSIR